MRVSGKNGKRGDSRRKKRTKRRRLSENLWDEQCSSGEESDEEMLTFLKDIGAPVGQEEDMEGDNDSQSGMSS